MAIIKQKSPARIVIVYMMTLIASAAQAEPIFQSKAVTLHMDGYFIAHEVNARGKTRMQDGSSRIGIGLNSAAYGAWATGFYLEWGIRAISSYRALAPQPASNGATASLYLRHGHALAKHEKWGAFSAGKQSGVYYDITQITDSYHVSGGLASGTYTIGSDGGFTGTGRADSALTWRKHWETLGGEVQLGLQYATPSAKLDTTAEAIIDTDTLVVLPPGSSEDGTNHSLSLSYKADLGDGLFLGAAYNRVNLSIQSDGGLLYDTSTPGTPILIAGPLLFSTSGSDMSFAVGVSYGKGAFEKGFYGAAVFQRSTSSEQAPVVSTGGYDIFFSARGSESFFSYTWGFKNCYSVYFGHNFLKSNNRVFESLSMPNSKFRLAQYYLGLQYRWNEHARIYLESALDNSNKVARSAVDNFVAVGIRIDI